jgi:hypothetical protein
MACCPPSSLENGLVIWSFDDSMLSALACAGATQSRAMVTENREETGSPRRKSHEVGTESDFRFVTGMGVDLYFAG